MNYGFTGTPAGTIGPWYTPGTPWLLESVAFGSTANAIWTYTDKLTVGPTLTGPANNSSTGRTTTATLSWKALPTATRYEVWVSTDPGFSTLVVGTPAYPSTTSFTATGLQPGVKYYWMVCSASAVYAAPNTGRNISPWSAAWNFTTGLGIAEWNPFWDSNNVAPRPGATGVPLRPAFQWNPSDFATGYEFELSKAPGTTAGGFYVDALVGLTGTNALVNTVWQCDRDLDYSTTYYWHVRAMSATSQSVWANGTFTTMEKPVPPAPPVQVNIPPAPAPITPAWIWAIVIIGAILVIAVIVLIVTTRRVP
jgi:hypothetical protein